MEDRKIRVRKEEIGNGEEKYLGGKASYKRVVDKFIGERLVLCNNIVEFGSCSTIEVNNLGRE